MRELLAGSWASETGASLCSVVARGRAWLFALAHIFFFLLHCIHIWVLDGWRGLFHLVPFFLLVCMLATLAFVACIVLVTFAGTWLIHCDR